MFASCKSEFAAAPRKAPPQPTYVLIYGLNPGLTANNNAPKIYGSSESGGTVYVYTTSNCSGSSVAFGEAGVFGSPGITLSVADNTVTTYYVQSISRAGAVSNCVGPVTYAEDSTAPVAPSGWAMASPANAATSNDTTPLISGNAAENTAIVKVYSNAACTTLMNSGTVAGGAFAITAFTVPAGDGVKSFWYTIEDTVGNVGTCTTTALSYTLDTTAPSAPSAWAMASPANAATSNDTTPLISGNAAENTAIVKVYSNAACTTLMNSGTVAGGAFAITAFTVPAGDGVKSFWYTIEDTVGNVGTCATTALSYTLDTTAPTSLSVTSTKTNGEYTVGTVIDVRVTFSEAVIVNITGGTPTITLETGVTDRAVNYTSGSTTTELLFNYTVQTGDNSLDLDYIVTTPLALNLGTIKDAAGNDATLTTLPAPGAGGSLGANKALLIDSPAVLTISDGATYNYGPRATGSTTDYTFTVTNSGGIQATLATVSTVGLQLAAPYTFVAGGTCVTSAVVTRLTGTCTLITRFSPTTLSVASDTIELSYNDGTGTIIATRPVTGTGISSFYVAYVTNQTAGTISQYLIDPTTGILSSLGDLTAGAGSYYRTQISPTSRFAYQPRSDGNAYSYSISASTGKLGALGSFFVASGGWASNIAIDPTERFAYIANSNVSPRKMRAFSINATTGDLTFISEQDSWNATRDAVIDPTGRFLFEAMDDYVTLYPIDQSTGALSAVQFFGSGGITKSIALHPSGKFLYAVTNTANAIKVFSVNQSTGALTLTSTNAYGATPSSIALSPNGKFAYLTISTDFFRVYVHPVDQSTGALGGSTSVIPLGYSHHVAIDPSGRFAYVVHTLDNAVSMYSINQSTGALTALSTPTVATGTGPVSITVAPVTSRFLQAALTTAGKVGTYAVNSSSGLLTANAEIDPGGSGTIRAVTSFLSGLYAYIARGADILMFSANTDTGALTALGTPSIAILDVNSTSPSLRSHPFGGYVYALDNYNGVIAMFSVGQATGVLSALTPATISTGAVGPIALAVDPCGLYAYSGNAANFNVHMYSVNLVTGELTALGTPTINAGAASRGIVIDPTCRFLYVSQENVDKVAMYSIDRATGQLTAIGAGTIATGDGPRGIVIEKTGRYLYTANINTTTVSVFSINRSTGELTAIANANTDFARASLLTDTTGRYLSALGIGGTLKTFAILRTDGTPGDTLGGGATITTSATGGNTEASALDTSK